MPRSLPAPIAKLFDRFFLQANIRLKLFYAILALLIVMIVATNSVGHYIFNRDFLGYLNEQAQQRIEATIPRLEQAYRENGSWDFVRDNPRAWFELIRPAIAEHTGRESDVIIDGHRVLTATDLTGATLRFSLLDAERKLVIGYPNIGPDARVRPIMRDDVIVGWVTQTPFESVIGAVDVRFQQSQLIAQTVIAITAILLAALLVVRISGALLKPLTRVARATHKLAGGDYAIRVEVESADEIGRLAQDFNQLAMTLERNEKLRREFMADVSHELRTPLGILNGQLEALEDGVLQPDADTVRSLKNEVTHLNKLVNDLYDLSLADAGALAYRKSDIDLTGILGHALQANEESFRKHGLELQAHDWPSAMPVHADPGRLHQLFNNLLQNSLRYTDSGGELQVSCRRDEQQWIVQFDDSAPGVESPSLDRLFERFYRVESSRNRASGGAGLGLAICRRIVDAHQGSIRAEASPLGGLRIIITLPVAAGKKGATA